MNEKKIVKSGKRKTAIARAVLTEGTGIVKINGEDYNNLHEFKKLLIEEVLRINQRITNNTKFNVNITIKGGGEKSQIEAARLALARAILEFTKSKALREVMMSYDKHMLIADVRRKEMYKPGDSKARRKRQKSYR